MTGVLSSIALTASPALARVIAQLQDVARVAKLEQPAQVRKRQPFDAAKLSALLPEVGIAQARAICKATLLCVKVNNEVPVLCTQYMCVLPVFRPSKHHTRLPSKAGRGGQALQVWPFDFKCPVDAFTGSYLDVTGGHAAVAHPMQRCGI